MVAQVQQLLHPSPRTVPNAMEELNRPSLNERTNKNEWGGGLCCFNHRDLDKIISVQILYFSVVYCARLIPMCWEHNSYLWSSTQRKAIQTWLTWSVLGRNVEHGLLENWLGERIEQVISYQLWSQMLKFCRESEKKDGKNHIKEIKEVAWSWWITGEKKENVGLSTDFWLRLGNIRWDMK